MERRNPVRGALALLLLGAALAFPSARAEDDAPRRSLLVKCRDADVARVLEALSDLDVEVYDLQTMARVAQPEALPALPDAYQAYARVLAVAKRLRDEGAQLAIVRLDVGERRIRLRVRTDGPTTVDRLRVGLASDAELAPRLGDKRAVEVGGAKSEGDAWQTDLQLRLDASAGAAANPTRATDALPLLASLLDPHLAAVGARLLRAGAERRDRRAASPVAVASQKFQLAPTTRGVLDALLARLSSEKGIVVTEIEWALEDPGVGGDALRAPAFELSWLVAVPD